MRVLLFLLIAFTANAQTGIFDYLRAQSVSSVEGAIGVWGVTKINKNYVGPSVRITDDTSGTDLGDFGWVIIVPYLNEWQWDYTSIDAALGGHEGKISKLYDQSGNGYDWSQSTKVNMPYYKTVGYTPDNLPSILFNNASMGLDHYMTSSLPTDSNDFGFVGVGQTISFFPGPLTSSSTDVLFYAAGNPSILVFSDNTVFRSSATAAPHFVSSSTAPIVNMNVVQMGAENKSGTGSNFFFDTYCSTTASQFATQRINTTAMLGKRANGQFKQAGIFKELIVYTSAMSATIEARMKADQRKIYRIQQKQNVLIVLVHSKARGYESTNTFNSPIINSPGYKFMQALGPDWSVLSYAVPSATITSFTASNTYSTVKDLIHDYPNINWVVFFLDCGNDFASSFSTITANQDALIADFKVSNPNVWFILTTVTSRTSYTAPQEMMRTTQINPYILAKESFSNKIITIDLSGVTALNVGGAGMDPDGIHFNTSGNQTLVDICTPYFHRAR